MDFELAAIARPSIDLTDREAAPEPATRCSLDARGHFGKSSVVR
jgi:hypothetical protein